MEKYASHVFLLLKERSIVGCIVEIRQELTENSELKPRLLITDFFTSKAHRRQGYMILLLSEYLKYRCESFDPDVKSMHERLNSVHFKEPLTKDGEKFLVKLAEELRQSNQTI